MTTDIHCIKKIHYMLKKVKKWDDKLAATTGDKNDGLISAIAEDFDNLAVNSNILEDKTGNLWLSASEADNPDMVLYRYDPSAGNCARTRPR